MMRSVHLRHCWSPQRLFAMLKDCQARERESWRNMLLSYPTNQHVEVGPADRDCAVTWMSDLNSRFNFYPETFFLAVHNLDRFLTSVKSRPKYLKCIAVTCLYVASKIIEEEEHIPGTNELVELSRSGCRSQDVLRMERIILTKLSWEFHTPTPLSYLEIFHALTFCHCSKNAPNKEAYSEKFLASHLNQLTTELQHFICNYSVALFPSSVFALALLSLRIQDLFMESYHWATVTSKIQALSKIDTSDLMKCRDLLLSLLKKKQHNINPNNLVYVINAPYQSTGFSDAEHKNDSQPLQHQGGPIKRKANGTCAVALCDQIKKFHSAAGIQGNCVTVAKNNPFDGDVDMEMAQWHHVVESGSQNLSQGRVGQCDPPKYATVTKSSAARVDAINKDMEVKSARASCPPLMKAIFNDWDSSHSAGNYNDSMLYESNSNDIFIASEEEDDEQTERRKLQAMRTRPLTYAEIVKFGLLETTTIVSLSS